MSNFRTYHTRRFSKKCCIYIPLTTNPYVAKGISVFQDILIILLPLALQPAVGFGLSKNTLPFFFYQSPTFSIFLLPALEELFLLPLSSLSWTVRYQLVKISLRLLPSLSNSNAPHRMVVLEHRPQRGHQISRPLTTPCGETWRTWSTGKNRSKRRATAKKHEVRWPRKMRLSERQQILLEKRTNVPPEQWGATFNGYHWT